MHIKYYRSGTFRGVIVIGAAIFFSMTYNTRYVFRALPERPRELAMGGGGIAGERGVKGAALRYINVLSREGSKLQWEESEREIERERERERDVNNMDICLKKCGEKDIIGGIMDIHFAWYAIDWIHYNTHTHLNEVQGISESLSDSVCLSVALCSAYSFFCPLTF